VSDHALAIVNRGSNAVLNRGLSRDGRVVAFTYF
jgi:hypothetical protein